MSSAAAALAATHEFGEALLVDMGGDQSSILGLPATSSPGLFDWLASKAKGRESIERLAVPTSAGLHLVPPGTVGRWDIDRSDELVELLVSFDCPVIVDCGLRGPWVDRQSPAVDRQMPDLVERLCSKGRSVLVSSSCYLAVRRAVRIISAERDDQGSRSTEVRRRRLGDVPGPATDGLVVVADPGRALDAGDVANVTQLDLLASCERDPAVARCVDAGLFLQRPPRALLRMMRNVL